MSGSNGAEARPIAVLGKRVLYSSEWVGLEQWSVRLPDGQVIPDYHVVVYPQLAVAVVARDEAGRFLLIDHYRFITDTRGWEIPAGRVEPGEAVEAAARRELLEETGHTAAAWRHLGRYHPSNGSSNQEFHVFTAGGLSQVAEVADTNEVLGCQWFTADEVRALLQRNDIRDGFSLTALLWAMAA